MGVGEANSHLRSMKLDLVRVAREVLIRAGIAHLHVISHHQDNVGRLGGGIRAGNRSQSENHRDNGRQSAYDSDTLRDTG